MEDNQIQVNKYVFFDIECGRFCLTLEASELIYRERELICSYSGANDWVHHFTCEMLDFCSGSSIYNYALGTYKHEEELLRLYKINNKEVVIDFVKRTIEEPWGKKMYQDIENIIKG